MKRITFADIFAGIGGFRIGLERLGFQCLYSCEKNEACRQVYFDNFGDLPEVDISDIDFPKIPDVNIITAGFPCQPFSICGKRQGFSDRRGTIFFHLCNLLQAKKPDVAILENVKHLLHLEKGSVFEEIITTLEDLGYFVSYSLLNAKDFGLPQNRERVFIIASKHKPFDFSRIKPKLEIPQLKEFLSKTGDFQYIDDSEYTLIKHPKQQDSGLIFVGYRNKSIWKKGIRPHTEHLSRVHRQPNRIYSVEGVHPTLPSQESSGRFFIYLPQENRVRKLTIEECYRIMGFPKPFKRSASLSEAYKQIGNSVATNIIYELGKEIMEQKLTIPCSKFNNRARGFKKSEKPIQLTIPGLRLTHCN